MLKINKSKYFYQVFEKNKWFGLRKIYWIIRRGTNDLKQILIDLKIINKELSQNVINRRIARKIISIYETDTGQNVNFSQYFLGFGLIHYSFVRNLKPKNILCIGSRKGFIPAILALACKDNGFGHVDFVDAGYDQNKHYNHWSGIGFWKKYNPQKHFSKMEINNFITTYIMTSEKYSRKYPNKKFQYIYIDGDHSYKGIYKDYKLFWPRLKKGGFLVLHDVVVRGFLDKGEFGVWKFWNKFVKNNKNSIIFPFPKESGLGIIQKI